MKIAQRVFSWDEGEGNAFIDDSRNPEESENYAILPAVPPFSFHAVFFRTNGNP
jgi:hypothetical protein